MTKIDENKIIFIVSFIASSVLTVFVSLPLGDLTADLKLNWIVLAVVSFLCNYTLTTVYYFAFDKNENFTALSITVHYSGLFLFYAVIPRVLFEGLGTFENSFIYFTISVVLFVLNFLFYVTYEEHIKEKEKEETPKKTNFTPSTAIENLRVHADFSSELFSLNESLEIIHGFKNDLSAETLHNLNKKSEYLTSAIALYDSLSSRSKKDDMLEDIREMIFEVESYAQFIIDEKDTQTIQNIQKHKQLLIK